MKLIYFVIPLLLLAISAQAQYNETITTGRPGQSIGPRTVGKHVLQNQTGYNYSNDFHEISSVFRYGITSRFELNGVVSAASTTNNFEANSTGLSNLQFGFRVNILNKNESPISLGIQSRFIVPINTDVIVQNRFAHKSIVSASYSIADILGIVANTGIIINPELETTQLPYTLAISANITSKTGVFIEAYGNLHTPNTNFDAGLSYLIAPDLLIDASAGITDLSDINWFVDFGVSWRVKLGK